MRSLIFPMMFLSVMLLSFSCKSSKGQSGQATEDSAKTEQSELILSFFSPGNGIDKNMLDQVVEFLKTNYPTVNYNRVRWGREGEVDFCFDLAGMTVDSKAKLKADLKELVAASNRVRVKEDEACRTPKAK